MSRIRPVSLARAIGASAAAALADLACHPATSVFAGDSDSARRVSHLGWYMIAVAAVIFVVVFGLLIASTLRNRERDANAVDMAAHGNGWPIFGGAVMPAAVLAATFVVAMGLMGSYSEPAREPALTIDVTGHQWWWEVDYQDSLMSRRFKTANEIHVPVGEPVQIVLKSADVIHSFWVPNLHGKLDLIPGYTNVLRLTADRPGVYHGQCAEYCGLQHANMAILVIAEDSATFRGWEQAQLAPASAPRDSLTAYGEHVFLTGPCAMCHAVRGSGADGQVAPDLTHVGSRKTLAAGALPNQLGPLEAWITNAQSFKPGTKMPTLTQFNGRELRALAAYVYSLR